MDVSDKSQKTKYTIRMFSLFHIFTVIWMLKFGFDLAVLYFNPVIGIIFILIALGKLIYMAVWKLTFDIRTGEFYYRNLFKGVQKFHLSEIEYFCPDAYHGRGAVLNAQFALGINGMKISMPKATSKSLSQFG